MMMNVQMAVTLATLMLCVPTLLEVSHAPVMMDTLGTEPLAIVQV